MSTFEKLEQLRAYQKKGMKMRSNMNIWQRQHSSSSSGVDTSQVDAKLATIGNTKAERAAANGKFIGRMPLISAMKERELMKKYGEKLDRIASISSGDVRLITPKVMEVLVAFFSAELLKISLDVLFAMVSQMTKYKQRDGKQCVAFTALVGFLERHPRAGFSQ